MAFALNFTLHGVEKTEKGFWRITYKNTFDDPAMFLVSTHALRLFKKDSKTPDKKNVVPTQLFMLTRRSQYNPGELIVLELRPKDGHELPDDGYFIMTALAGKHPGLNYLVPGDFNEYTFIFKNGKWLK